MYLHEINDTKWNYGIFIFSSAVQNLFAPEVCIPVPAMIFNLSSFYICVAANSLTYLNFTVSICNIVLL
jgi:hypothetical protein